MGIAIRSAAPTRFSNIVGFPTLTNRSDIVGEYVIGESFDFSDNNTANNPNPLILDSSNTVPVEYFPGYAKVRSGDTGSGGFAGFNTNIALQNKSYTLIQITRGALPAVSTNGSFFGILSITSRLTAYNSQNGSITIVPDLPIAVSDVTKFHFVAATMPYLGAASLYRYQDNVLEKNTGEGNGSSNRGTLPIKIGTGTIGSAKTAAIADVAYVAIYERALNDAEVQAAYESLKAYLLNYRNIAIS